VFDRTLATVKRQIKQAENPTPAVVISVEAAHVNNANLRDCSTSEVALEEPEIGSTDPNILIDNNYKDEELHFGMPGGRGNFKDEGDNGNDIPTTSQRRRATTELDRSDLRISHVDGYDGKDGDYLDADVEEEASQADDGSMQNVAD